MKETFEKNQEKFSSIFGTAYPIFWMYARESIKDYPTKTNG